ncbi:helix-turn-helix domain-containing protein [Streptomyces sp. NBC_00887]|uniref:helix-turn-helix domain-containing protein n=1 Tax=Streptomyces sp. NBC_00887 TaxID=2975859 RepID=UPI00386A8B1C|nr:helix-turn-helix domain-containing protein [Streptomyces sp. NBC_00887]
MTSTTVQTTPTCRLLRVDAAALVLGFARATAFEEIRRGRLRTVKVGRRLIPTEYIEEYIELLKTESAA